MVGQDGQMAVSRKRNRLVSTANLFGRDDGSSEVKTVDPSFSMAYFGEWVVELGRAVGLEATVVFIHADSTGKADCTANTMRPVVRFNTRYFDDEWFTRRGDEQFEAIIHEFAHAVASSPMEHGPRWGEACVKVGALLVSKMMAMMMKAMP